MRAHKSSLKLTRVQLGRKDDVIAKEVQSLINAYVLRGAIYIIAAILLTIPWVVLLGNVQQSSAYNPNA